MAPCSSSSARTKEVEGLKTAKASNFLQKSSNLRYVEPPNLATSEFDISGIDIPEEESFRLSLKDKNYLWSIKLDLLFMGETFCVQEEKASPSLIQLRFHLLEKIPFITTKKFRLIQTG